VALLMLNPACLAAAASTADTSWFCISITRPHARQMRN
jgi:hypothetical protein